MRRLTPLLAAAAAILVGCGAAPPRTAERPAPSGTPAPPRTTERPAPSGTPAPLPAADGALPARAGAFAAQLADVAARLDAAVDRWPGRTAAPEDVTLLGLRWQRMLYRLAERPRLARAVLPRVPGRTRADARDVIAAQHALAVLNRPTRHRRFHTGPAEPPARLKRYYREGTRRSHVGWPVLAAVNLVESNFNKLRNDSVAGARGPMQFMPSTWATYGRGDVHDPHAAILAAARFLHAAGAPADERGALYRYNPSPLYVTAVERYARIVRRDRRGFPELYAWQVFVRTPEGLRRLTGPRR
jgi:soluble lytic murein transglycosylase-like protein